MALGNFIPSLGGGQRVVSNFMLGTLAGRYTAVNLVAGANVLIQNEGPVTVFYSLTPPVTMADLTKGLAIPEGEPDFFLPRSSNVIYICFPYGDSEVYVNVGLATDAGVAQVPATGVTLNSNAFTLNDANPTFQLVPTVAPANATNQSVTYSSSDTTKATVDANGLVSRAPGATAGTATITATPSAGTTATATATVVAAAAQPVPVSQFSISPTSGSMSRQQTIQLVPTVNADATDKSVTYASDDLTIAVVNSAGLVVPGTTIGNTNIRATASNGQTIVVNIANTGLQLETRDNAFLADSRAFLTFTNPGGLNTYLRSVGVTSNIQGQCQGLVRYPTPLISGVAGDTSQQILARAPALITAMKAAGVYRVMYIGSTNDRTAGLTLAQSQSYVQQTIDLFMANKMAMDIISETPRGNGSSSYELTLAQAADHYAMHMWFETTVKNSSPYITVFNVWDTWVDPSSGNKYWVLPGVTQEGIHPSVVGADLWAQVMAPTLRARQQKAGIVSVLANAVANSILTNSALTGSGGTKEAAAANITGPIPTGWTIGGQNLTGLNLTAAYETIGGIACWSITASGTGTDTGQPIIQLKQQYTNLVNGDPAKLVANVYSKGTGLADLSVSNLLTPAYAQKYDTECSVPTLPYPSRDKGWESRETPVYVKESTQTLFEARLEITIAQQAAVNFKVAYAFGAVIKQA